MLRNYLKIGFRNLLKQKAYSLINILGLAVGLTSGILILLWIRHEVTYDQFHEKSESIYRVTSHLEQISAAISPAPLPVALAEQFPEIESAVRTSLLSNHLLSVDNLSYEESRILYADSNFMEVFTFPLSQGDPQTALEQPNSIMLTESMAVKYFGPENPIGKTIRLDKENEMAVTGVLKAVPSTSHLQFDFIIPMSYLAKTERDLKENIWDNFNYYGYVKFEDNFNLQGGNLEDVEGKIDLLYKEKVDELQVNFKLQPMSEIHLYSDFLGDVPGQGNIQYVYILSITVLFILLIAAINFMNLATARSTRRAREVGFRKVAGARRRQLIIQFLTESSLIAFISLLIAVGLVVLFLPSFNTLTGKDIGIEFLSPDIVLGIIGLTLLIGLLAGSYPAVYLSGFNPAKVLSMQNDIKGGHKLFRNALVVTQFVFSIVLIIGTVVIYQQQQFIKNQNLGYNKENLIYVNLNRDLRPKLEAYKTQLENNPYTDLYTIVNDIPTNVLSGTVGLDWEGKDPEMQVLFSNLSVDEHFIDVFGMKMRSGRPFSKEFGTDETGYLLNETAIDLMGMDPDEAVGKSFTLWGDEGKVIGVVSDFHFKPIQQPIEPMVLKYGDRERIAVIRTTVGETEATVKELERINQELSPAYPFEYAFVDQDLENLYQSEERLGSLTKIFAMIAIFISCLGLYGLSAFLAEQRKKEIGVRKVVGASVANVVYMLSKDFTKPIWISMVLAIPLAYFAINKWLENFAYHVELSWVVILLSCLVAWIIALTTISFETLRAAVANPIDSLHQE